MKISEHWLQQWVNPDLSTTELTHQMTMLGLQVDSVTPVAGHFSKVVVGEVLSTKPHPDANKLTCCEVTVGDKKPLSIVCGASNVRPGLKVAVAMIGAVLPGDFKIKAAKLRGELSEGMLCSARELQLHSWFQTEGIIELPNDASVGGDFNIYFQSDDRIIDIEITPNRGDCLSIRGIARDVAAVNQLPLHALSIELVPAGSSEQLPIKLTAPADCPHYVGRLVRQINNTVQTPSWMQHCLQRSGLRLINPAVDICNYVMLELGQPMHAFDCVKLQGVIHIRRAHKQESLQLLNEQIVTLTPEDLVIADDKKVLALAGIMGGLESGVSANTTDIFLESAFFSPKTICLSVRRHNISSDSAYRFERGVDFNLQVDAIERATALLLEITGGEVAEITEIVSKTELPQRAPIMLLRAQIERVLGMPIVDTRVVTIFEKLGMHVVTQPHGWQVTPPSYRFDIALPIDLIEELARMTGYEKIPAAPITAPLTIAVENTASWDRRLRTFLMDRDYAEAITYSFISPEYQQLFSPTCASMVLRNPLSIDQSVMRSSLWPGLLQALQTNVRHQLCRVRLFEVGLCFELLKNETLQQTQKLAMVVTGSELPEQWGVKEKPTDFYTMKADVMALLAITKSQKQFTWRKAENSVLHPGRSIALYHGEQLVGWLGELHPEIMAALDLRQPVVASEFDLHYLSKPSFIAYQAFSKFPAMRRDLAVVLDENITAAELQEKITKKSGELLKNVQIFDIYRGNGVENGKKSIALGLTFQDASRTLRDEEINEIIHGVVAMLERDLNATLRG